MNVIKVSAANVPLVQVLAAFALAGVLYAISLMAAEDRFTPGELISFIVAAALIFEPIRRLTNINETIQKGMAAAASIFELLDQPEETNNGKHHLETYQGKIEFKNLNFTYPEANSPTLNNFSLTVQPKTTVAIVGQSGSGKTTLANLIARFYETPENTLYIDDLSINDIALKNLRNNIAFVSQHVVLFNDTIAANIAYGHDSFDEASIIEAAKSAHAWEFIEQLPDGLQTMIGDNGTLLSGGQRQRLALARAFLKNAPILILDEATSALDNQSELFIQQAMDELRNDRTVIIIAHCLSTIENADHIVLMEKGNITEQGNHQILIEKQGAYYQLYQQGNLDK